MSYEIMVLVTIALCLMILVLSICLLDLRISKKELQARHEVALEQNAKLKEKQELHFDDVFDSFRVFFGSNLVNNHMLIEGLKNLVINLTKDIDELTKREKKR